MDSEAARSNTLPRIVLAITVVIALIAVGLSIWKRKSPEPEPAAATAPTGDVATMISGLEAKLKTDPNDAEGWRMLGWAFFETGKFAEAAQAYARATQLVPGKAEYWSSLGEARVLAGGGNVPGDAKAAFDRAIAIDPKDPRARYFLAVNKDIAGDHKGAIADWIALLRDTPAGAPWEADVRRIIAEVAAKEKIDISKEMAGLRPAPPSPGAAIANAPIPGPTAQDMQAASGMPKGQQDMMIQGMVDGLEGKLKANPDNAQGWIMLMRSRMQLGETAKASAAYRSAKAAFAGKPAAGQIEAAAEELGVPR